MKTPYNILIVGAGKIGTIRANVARKLSPKSTIYVFDSDFKKANDLAKNVNGIAIKSLNKGLQDSNINLVVVAVPNKYSKSICISALKNKKHVLCEKPMGRNYKEAKEIDQAVNKYKRKFKCGFNHRYHPAISKAYRIVKQGEIGNILFIRAVYGHGGRTGYEKEWRARKSLSGGGELLDQGSHLIDLCNWFFNFEDTSKSFCIAKPMFWKMNVDDNAFAIFETKSGKVAQIHSSWTQWKNLFRFEVYGTKGALKVHGLGKSYGVETLSLYKRIRPGAPPQVIKKQYKSYDKSWEDEWLDFKACIDSKRLHMSNEKESLQVMKIIGDLYQPHKKIKPN